MHYFTSGLQSWPLLSPKVYSSSRSPHTTITQKPSASCPSRLSACSLGTGCLSHLLWGCRVPSLPRAPKYKAKLKSKCLAHFVRNKAFQDHWAPLTHKTPFPALCKHRVYISLKLRDFLSCVISCHPYSGPFPKHLSAHCQHLASVNCWHKQSASLNSHSRCQLEDRPVIPTSSHHVKGQILSKALRFQTDLYQFLLFLVKTAPNHLCKTYIGCPSPFCFLST